MRYPCEKLHYSTLTRLSFSWCDVRISFLPLAGNKFNRAEEIEFYDAQNTRWIGNEFPSDACLDIVTSNAGDSVPVSTFTADTNGLPEEC